MNIFFIYQTVSIVIGVIVLARMLSCWERITLADLILTILLFLFWPIVLAKLIVTGVCGLAITVFQLLFKNRWIAMATLTVADWMDEAEEIVLWNKKD